jgi:hypothetical protein
MKKQIIFAIAISMMIACTNSSSADGNEKSVNTENSEELSVPEKPQIGETAEIQITFDDEKVGEMPAGWSNAYTGKGGLGKWEIVEDNGEKALAQVSQKNGGYHFDVIVKDDTDYQDLEIEVDFKGVKGEEDQGGGPVWRYQDADNYYIARANPLEDNYRVYKVVDGNRKQLASASFDIPTGEWHKIKIRMIANHIVCFYDGEKFLDVKDDTFKESGKVGLWIKADAVTWFDDLKIAALK